MYTINNLNIFSIDIDGKTLNAMHEVMKHDWVVAGALMPDAHFGMEHSLPIGGVVATKGVIVPAYVGYDIGCGMCAVRTTYKLSDIISHREEIFQKLIDTIPIGVGVGRDRAVYTYRTIFDAFQLECSDFLSSYIKKNGVADCGSLGSGNHFLEIGSDENDNVWIIIHSGSRGTGHACASYYMVQAQPFTGSKEGHFPLNVDSTIGSAYIRDLAFMLEFALANREILIHDTLNCIDSVIAGKVISKIPFSKSMLHTRWYVDSFINRNHNHAECKDDMWIHRKGATHAENGMMGVIPGNMRDGSFIVKGKGCKASLCSSSHGAGRVLGRKEAKRKLDPSELVSAMKGITSGVENDPQAFLDEAPLAYKDIFRVMQEQQDLVEVVAHVKPIINVKR